MFDEIASLLSGRILLGLCSTRACARGKPRSTRHVVAHNAQSLLQKSFLTRSECKQLCGDATDISFAVAKVPLPNAGLPRAGRAAGSFACFLFRAGEELCLTFPPARFT